MDFPIWSGEIEVPQRVWLRVNELNDPTPEVFFGCLAFMGYEKYSQMVWEGLREDLRDQFLRRGVLREFLQTQEPERTYSAAFFMAQDIDLRL